MTSMLIKKYDDLIRCTNVLSEGIEHEFIKFVSHQEKSRRKWQMVEEESHESRKFVAKYKAEQDTLEVKLKMARHQLDLEMKKRLKAEQSVDHLARQLELIKELLLDKSTDKQTLVQTFSKYDKSLHATTEASMHFSYTVDTSIELPDSEYDISENDILDETGVVSPGHARKGKRGRPSAPPLQLKPPTTDDTSEDSECPKRSRVSVDNSSELTKVTRMSEELHHRRSVNRYSISQSKRQSKTCGGVEEFIASSSALSSSYDTDEAYDKENPIVSPPQSEKKKEKPHLYPSLSVLGTPPSELSASPFTPRSNPKDSPEHAFVTKFAVKMETCVPCNKKLRFGSNVMKCRDCKIVCHPECKHKAATPCQPTKDTPGKKEGTIGYYVEGSKVVKVPELVIQCIQEIETRGLKHLGLYRIPGSDRDVKELKEKFLRKKNPDLHRISDINVICCCLNDFLRGLSEPLVTFGLHGAFMTGASCESPEERTHIVQECIHELPAVNRETLATIILHLQRVASTPESQMNISKLSNIFGPTVVGYRSPNPSHVEMLEDAKHQKEVVAVLLEIHFEFWEQSLVAGPQTKSKTPLQARSPPFNPNFKGTPSTPERKQPVETNLGTTDPSSQLRSNKKKYNAMTPKVLSKTGRRRQHHFFNSPS